MTTRCIVCEGIVFFDHHGSIEVQFHHPDLSIEHFVMCSTRCVKRFVEVTVFEQKVSE